MKVLLIDDDAWQLELFERELLQAKHVVIKASNVYDAIAELDDALPDVVVLDLMLPGSNGITLLNEMRSYDDLAELPVVVVSGSRVETRTLTAYGVKSVLDKAKIHPGDLLAAINEVIK